MQCLSLAVLKWIDLANSIHLCFIINSHFYYYYFKNNIINNACISAYWQNDNVRWEINWKFTFVYANHSMLNSEWANIIKTKTTTTRMSNHKSINHIIVWTNSINFHVKKLYWLKQIINLARNHEFISSSIGIYFGDGDGWFEYISALTIPYSPVTLYVTDERETRRAYSNFN